jgi:hypothetical protein
MVDPRWRQYKSLFALEPGNAEVVFTIAGACFLTNLDTAKLRWAEPMETAIDYFRSLNRVRAFLGECAVLKRLHRSTRSHIY